MPENRTLLYSAMVLALLTLTACGGPQPLPTADPGPRALLEKMAESLAFTQTKDLNTPGHVRIPLAKGQWITTLTRYVNPDGDIILSTTRVIEVQGDTVTLEVESHAASQNGQPNLTLVQIAGYPTQLPLGPDKETMKTLHRQMRILRMATRTGDGQTMEMPSAYLQFGAHRIPDFINPGLRTTPISTQPVDTPYIRARDAKVFDVEISLPGIRSTGRIHVHGGIPIHNQILYENEDLVMHTIAYDLKGAQQTLFLSTDTPPF